MAGKDVRNLWNPKPSDYDFYDLKSSVDEFLEKCGLKKFELRRSENKTFHPGRTADICAGKDIIGTFGEIHPDVLENMEIDGRVLACEIDMEKLFKYAKSKTEYKRVVKYPAVERDVAVVLSDDVLVGNMLKEIEKLSELVEKVELFDVYRGEKVGEGLKSVAVNMIFRARDRTLNEEEVTKLFNDVLLMIEKKFAGKLRSI